MLVSEEGVRTAFCTIPKRVLIVVLASSQDPTETLLATPASDVGVVTALVTIAVRVLRVDLTSSQDPTEGVRVTL